MQWVETTGKSVEEAKGLALDQLGVGEDDLDFEILEEPRSGLFGRIKGEARVRARVRPAAVRPKLDRRDRRRGRDKTEGPAAVEGNGAAGPPSDAEGTTPSSAKAAPKTPRASSKADTVAPTKGRSGSGRASQQRRQQAPATEREDTTVSAQQVGEEAKKFLIDLVSAFGVSGEVDLREDGDDLELTVSGNDLGLLVGPRGNTLLAIQDLTRVASQRRLGDHDTRLRVDVGGYRERRREALSRFALQIAEQVASTGEARALEPMPSADRKVIHDVLTEHTSVVTRSEGDDPHRRVVIAPANA